MRTGRRGNADCQLQLNSEHGIDYFLFGLVPQQQASSCASQQKDKYSLFQIVSSSYFRRARSQGLCVPCHSSHTPWLESNFSPSSLLHYDTHSSDVAITQEDSHTLTHIL